MQHYKLNLAHYFSAPSLAWDAMLKMTGVELELMVEQEFHDIIDKGTRGGICCISRKFAVQTTNTSQTTMQACHQNT